MLIAKNETQILDPIQPAVDSPPAMSTVLIMLSGSVITVLIQQFFNSKNRKASEQSELVERLVEGLQENTKQLLEGNTKALQELKAAVDKLNVTVELTSSGHEKAIAQLEKRVRDLEKK